MDEYTNLGGYESIHAAPPAAFEGFPDIEDTAAVINQVNRLFDPYVFFEQGKDSIELWCSCCLTHGSISIPPHTITTIEYELLYNKHNEHVTCPYCGTRAIYKNARRLGKKIKLLQWRPIVVLAEKDGDLYARAYWARKTYDVLNAPPEFYLVEGYHFTPGKATMYAQSYRGFNAYSISGNYDPVHRVITEPFTSGNYHYWSYESYAVFGIEAIGKSAFRYCGYETYEPGIPARWGLEDIRLRNEMMKFLAASCVYPRQIEMLLKTNCAELVDDLVRGRKKNKAIFNWTKDNYLDAFGLTKTEMREWRESGCDTHAIAIYKRLRRAGMRESFEKIKQVDNVCPYDSSTDTLIRLSCKLKIKPSKLCAYLLQGVQWIDNNALQTYKDYIDMAELLGWDLKNETVKLPKDMYRKHDEAAIEVSAKMANEAPSVTSTDLLKRCAKYNFEMGDYLIRCATTANEIIIEGKVLCHCVGGYAQRHMQGALTICFLRRKDAPHKSLYTIEMQGDRLMQMFGYKNDLGAPPSRQTMAWMLDVWLDWITKGSKRDENGKPKLPKRKEVKTA